MGREELGRATAVRVAQGVWVVAWVVGVLLAGGARAELSLAGGYHHSCAVAVDGRVACWGRNDRGQLGTGGGSTNEPQWTGALGAAAVGLTAGEEHSCALLVDGSVRCWGDDTYSQLGRAEAAGWSSVPGEPTGLRGATSAIAISCGYYHCCVVGRAGDVWCWGQNNQNQVGSAAQLPQSVVSEAVRTDALVGRAVSVSAGQSHTCVIVEDGRVQCWGDNGSLQLGVGASAGSSVVSPTLTQALGGRAEALSAGMGHTCAVLEGGQLKCWGNDMTQQTSGSSGQSHREAPTVPAGLAGVPVAAVGAGDFHTCAILASSGAVWCWGLDTAGQLGSSSPTSDGSPGPTDALGGSAVALLTGDSFSCALLAGGGAEALQCWGDNNFGQLGTPQALTDVPTPAAALGADILAPCSAQGQARRARGDACAACPAGSFSLFRESDACWPCARGWYAAAAGAWLCTQCPGAANTTGEGSDSLRDCDLACARGQYQDAGAGGACVACPRGRFSTADVATSADACEACPAGRFSGAEGANSSAVCAPCPAGTASSAPGASDAGACAECPAGRFAPPSAPACLACSRGTVTRAAGSDVCDDCPAGQSSPPAAVACNSCAAGQAASRATGACTACPAGSTSEAGDEECTPCSPGRFGAAWPGGGRVCLRCPAGRHSDAGATECAPCADDSCGATAPLPTLHVLPVYAEQAEGAGAGPTPTPPWAVLPEHVPDVWGLPSLPPAALAPALVAVRQSTHDALLAVAVPLPEDAEDAAGGGGGGGLRIWGGEEVWVVLEQCADAGAPLASAEERAARVHPACAEGATVLALRVLLHEVWSAPANGSLACVHCVVSDAWRAPRPSRVAARPAWAAWPHARAAVLHDALQDDAFAAEDLAVAVSRAAGRPHVLALRVHMLTAWPQPRAPAPLPGASALLASAWTAGSGHVLAPNETARAAPKLSAADAADAASPLFPLAQLALPPRARGPAPGGVAVAAAEWAWEEVVAVAAGALHSCAVTARGRVRCWGWGALGQLGYPDDTQDLGDDERVPDLPYVPVGRDGAEQVVAVAAGEWHTCALLARGAVRCWGAGAGAGGPPDADVDVGAAATAITSGTFHTCVLTTARRVRCWGENAAGQLGYGHTDTVGDDEAPATAGDVQLGGGDVALVAAGGRHTCAVLAATGALRCWGENAAGQLGYGHTDNVGDDELPWTAGDVPLGGARVLVARAGFSFTCALMEASRGVRCWGQGSSGQLGQGSMASVGDAEPPTAVGEVAVLTAEEREEAGAEVVDVQTGFNFACAVLLRGALRCWGANLHGELGYGHTDNVGDDELPWTAGDVPLGAPVAEVALGGYHACARLGEALHGELRCWGDGGSGRLGVGDTRSAGTVSAPAEAFAWDEAVDFAVDAATRQSVLPPPRLQRTHPGVLAVAAGAQHTCALLAGGAVRCWGASNAGERGAGDRATVGDDELPSAGADVALGGAAAEVAAGAAHACAILEATGRVRCWGFNYAQAAGYAAALATVGADQTPAQVGDVPMPAGERAEALAAGERHTCVLLAGGAVRCWGLNSDGQLGYARPDWSLPASHPGAVDLGGAAAVAVAAGGYHTCALLGASRQLRCWGLNDRGQLGYGHTGSVGDDEAPATAGDVPVTGDGGGVLAVACGGAHTCAVLAGSRALRCWGSNADLQLGYGAAAGNALGDDETPAAAAAALGDVQVGGEPVAAVALGLDHTCALLASGAVRCWGQAYFGQLGRGTWAAPGAAEVPGDVAALALGGPAIRLAAGLRHSCVVLASRRVRCWGDGTYGQLGLGDTRSVGGAERPADRPEVTVLARTAGPLTPLRMTPARSWWAPASAARGVHFSAVSFDSLATPFPPALPLSADVALVLARGQDDEASCNTDAGLAFVASAARGCAARVCLGDVPARGSAAAAGALFARAHTTTTAVPVVDGDTSRAAVELQGDFSLFALLGGAPAAVRVGTRRASGVRLRAGFSALQMQPPALAADEQGAEGGVRQRIFVDADAAAAPALATSPAAAAALAALADSLGSAHYRAVLDRGRPEHVVFWRQRRGGATAAGGPLHVVWLAARDGPPVRHFALRVVELQSARSTSREVAPPGNASDAYAPRDAAAHEAFGASLAGTSGPVRVSVTAVFANGTQSSTVYAHAACSDGFFLLRADHECAQCPVGATCQAMATARTVAARPGFWRLRAVPGAARTEHWARLPAPAFAACRSEDACVPGDDDALPDTRLLAFADEADGWVAAGNETADGGAAADWDGSRCAEGHFGVLCNRCRDGFFRADEGGCQRCEGNPWWAVLLMAVAGLVFATLMLAQVGAKDEEDAEDAAGDTEYFGIIVDHVVNVSVVMAQINIRWPTTVRSFFATFAAIFSMGFGVFTNAAQCYLGDRKDDALLTSSLQGFVFPVALLAYAALLWLVWPATCGPLYSRYIDHALAEQGRNRVHADLEDPLSPSSSPASPPPPPPSRRLPSFSEAAARPSEAARMLVRMATPPVQARRVWWDRMISSSVWVAVFVHPYVTSAAMSLLTCERVEPVPADGSSGGGIGGGEWSLERFSGNLDLSCEPGTPDRARFLSLAVPLIVLGCVGIPALVAGIFWVWRNNRQNPWLMRRLGFLYLSYRPHVFYWEVVSMAWSTVLITTVVLLKPSGNLAQLTAAMFIKSTDIFLFGLVRPWRDKTFNRLNTLTAYAELTALLTATMVEFITTLGDRVLTVAEFGAVVVLVIVLNVVVVAWGIYSGCRQTWLQAAEEVDARDAGRGVRRGSGKRLVAVASAVILSRRRSSVAASKSGGTPSSTQAPPPPTPLPTIPPPSSSSLPLAPQTPPSSPPPPPHLSLLVRTARAAAAAAAAAGASNAATPPQPPPPPRRSPSSHQPEIELVEEWDDDTEEEAELRPPRGVIA